MYDVFENAVFQKGLGRQKRIGSRGMVCEFSVLFHFSWVILKFILSKSLLKYAIILMPSLYKLPDIILCLLLSFC